jgi:hypothetical protein
MCLLVPRLQLDLASGVAASLFMLAAPLMVVCQVGQHVERSLMQLLAFEQHPLLESRIVVQKKLRQKDRIALLPKTHINRLQGVWRCSEAGWQWDWV